MSDFHILVGFRELDMSLVGYCRMSYGTCKVHELAVTVSAFSFFTFALEYAYRSRISAKMFRLEQIACFESFQAFPLFVHM